MLSRMQRTNGRKAKLEAKKHRSAKINKWICGVAFYLFSGICAFYAGVRLAYLHYEDSLSMLGTFASSNALFAIAIKNIMRSHTDYLDKEKSHGPV